MDAFLVCIGNVMTEALECVSKMPEAQLRRLCLHFRVDFPWELPHKRAARLAAPFPPVI